MNFTDIGNHLTTAVSFVWKTICNEKTDEELLQDFNNTIINEQASHATKMKIVERVMYRLIDRKKEMPLSLLKSVLDQYKNNNPIVVSALIFNEWTAHQNYKYVNRNNDFIYQDDFDEPVGHTLFDRALEETNREVFKILFSYELYSHENHLIHPLPLTISGKTHKPVTAIFNIPESEKKESCIKFLFRQRGYQKMFAEIPQCHTSQNRNSYGYIALKIRFEEKIEKYMTLLLPYIKNRMVINKSLSEVEGATVITPEIYKRLQKLLLESGAKPNFKALLATLVDNKNSQRFCCDEYPSLHSLPDFVQSRIDGTEELLRYGGKFDDDYNTYTEHKKNKFKAIPDTKFRCVFPNEAKGAICSALDEIAVKINTEEKFRNQFFTYDHQKNYHALLETLCQNYPRPAWWIMRVLDDRNCDTTITDMSHIPQFCFDQMNNLLLNPISDIKEIRSWKELMLFLLSKTPDIFRDKKRELEQLMLRIVEQGYSEKPWTYKLLRPLLIYCIKTSEFVLDISIQNGTEGSLIHLLCRVPFDVPMLRMISKTYQRKDPRSLYLACSENNKTRFGQEKHSTPKDIAKTWLKQCNDQEQRGAYQEVLTILRHDILTTKQKASSHCPYVDTVIGELSDLEKTTEWKIAHCSNI